MVNIRLALIGLYNGDNTVNKNMKKAAADWYNEERPCFLYDKDYEKAMRKRSGVKFIEAFTKLATDIAGYNLVTQ